MSRRQSYPSRRVPDSAQQHRDWLSLVEIGGSFLSMPVLRETWPSLDPLDKDVRAQLRVQHETWQDEPRAGQQAWISYVLRDLLGWDEALHIGGADALSIEVAEHEATITPSFALVQPGEQFKPDTTQIVGMICEPGQHPGARVKGDGWSATPVDRVAKLCRHWEIELALVTDGRWWAFVWAPRGKATTTAIFDAVDWASAAERNVVRAFVSILNRHRFFDVRDDETPLALLRRSADNQEEITEALGVQVRQAVELLVAAFGRADTLGNADLKEIDAHDIYRCAVAVMMRIVFLLFAEEGGLLPADNDLYARTYSAGRLCAELEQRAIEGSEEDLEHTTAAWHRLLALFEAVYFGVDHPRLRMHGYDGSIFSPTEYPWIPLNIDDRTVLYMLRSVQYVETGTGKNRERRRLSFKSLDVEQIGYVYEGLLSFEGFRARDTVVGLIGKEGLEEEVPLTDLVAHAASVTDIPGLAAKLADEYKASRIGSAKALEKKLAPLTNGARSEALRRLFAVTGGDLSLAERLLPFYGIIRTDLRDLPVVILPGALYVTESKLRKNTGTHYTPRFLAEEVVENALEPLVYEPGPLQTADKTEWKRKSGEEILDLKVADIAMGSGAFLVAACRYLAGHLVEAWAEKGLRQATEYKDQEATGLLNAEDDPLMIRARREIIEHCLYGVDINPMAVEMAKLSLWLISADRERPFTFLDDRLICGDSLLGITSLEQLEVMHMKPKEGRKLYEGAQRDLFDWTKDIREIARKIAEDRCSLSRIDGKTLDDLQEKRSILTNVEQEIGRIKLAADLAVASALAHPERSLNDISLVAAQAATDILSGSNNDMRKVCDLRNKWLKSDFVAGSFDREPLHWPLAFPEVFGMDRARGGGFDAIVGNPPYLGGPKIAPVSGEAYRKYLTDVLAGHGNGRADLVAYFVINAHKLLNSSGQTGLIATDTLAQGDTMETGLQMLLANGVEIRSGIRSEKWPTKGAALRYCVTCATRASLGVSAIRTLNGKIVPRISAALEVGSRVSEIRYKLSANAKRAFVGHDIKGAGFIVSLEEERQLLSEDPNNSRVISPYIRGNELNQQAVIEHEDSIINFRDWPVEVAESYRSCFARIERLVRPEREKKNRVAHRKYWWRYADYRRSLQSALEGLERIIAMTLHNKHLMPTFAPARAVYSHGCAVFASDDSGVLALVSGNIHYLWSTTGGASALSTTPRYAPSDKFETFPLPELTQEMRELGGRLDSYRREVMLARQSGLTKTYNLVFNEDCHDEDIVELRQIHKAIDEAVVQAYGWDDLLDQLDHGFHLVNGREPRYTIGQAAQREILDRLLELNHERYAEEVRLGLHDKKKKSKRGNAAGQDGMF